MPKSLVIKVDDIAKRYGSFLAVENINFSVEKGEVIGLVGLNGAGKSTIINLMLGFLRPTKGSVALFGRTVLPETAHLNHNKIGFATGDMRLFSNLTGKQYFDFIKRAYKVLDDKKTKDLCTQFEPQLDKKIRNLSRGNKQKIALIAAFMTDPELVILDEPSSGLDPLMQQKFVDLIAAEGTKGTTIFMSSHYLKEVADVCSRVLFIRGGKLVKDVLRAQLESINGKAVSILTRQVIRPPKSSELINHKRTANGYELSFIYKESSAKLQQWLSAIPLLLDFSVTDHDIESAFSDLYTNEEKEGIHV